MTIIWYYFYLQGVRLFVVKSTVLITAYYKLINVLTTLYMVIQVTYTLKRIDNKVSFLFSSKIVGVASDESADNGAETGTALANRSSHQGMTKDQTSLKKVSNRSYTESSTVINNGSSLQHSQTTGTSVLMGKIIGANKDVTEETLFLGAEIPKYGVVTEHDMELEKVRIFQRLHNYLNIHYYKYKQIHW